MFKKATTIVSVKDAEEFTQTLEGIGDNWWRQILLGKKMGVPESLGLTLNGWINERIGGTIRLSIEDRRQAVEELKAEGLNQKDIGKVLGVTDRTVRNDLNRKDFRSKAESGAEKRKPFPEVKQPDDEAEVVKSKREPSIGARLKAEVELKRETDHGIDDKEAEKLIRKAWAICSKNQNERACRYLAKCLIALLFSTYPELQDEVLF
jgi:transposase